MPFLNYIYLAVILVSFISSLTSFRLDFSFPLKLFACLLGLTFLVETGSQICIRVFHQKNNFWIYNAFTLVEFWVFGYYYYQIIRVKLLKRIILGFLRFYPVFWLITVIFIFGFNIWNSYVLIAGSFFSVLFALMYYYQLIVSPEIPSLRTLPEFWIATGMLIFYLGALPYFGTLNFFLHSYYKSNVAVAISLLNVLKILDTIMYALFTYGYLCRIINTKKS